MYRRSLNAHGYHLLSKDRTDEESYFSEIEDSDAIPDISNEFVDFWTDVERRPLVFKKQILKGMTQRMCSWLYHEDFTTSKLIAVVKKP